MRELGTKAGVTQPLSISGLEKCVRNFDPAIAWMVAIRFENLLTLDRHLKIFLDHRRSLPWVKISAKTRKICAFYRNWVEHENHVEIVTHKSDYIEHVWNGLPLGEVIANVIEIHIGLLTETKPASRISAEILDIMLSGNIPLGTYENFGIRRTIVIVE